MCLHLSILRSDDVLGSRALCRGKSISRSAVFLHSTRLNGEGEINLERRNIVRMRMIDTFPRNERTTSSDVDQFNRLAEIWWDSAGVMWPLHKLNQLRVPFVARAIKRHFGRMAERQNSELQSLKGVTILDIGCGAGLLSEAMAAEGATVTGVDPAARSIAIARQHAAANHLDIEYIEGSIEQVGSRTFDVVLNMEVVEHVEDLEGFMRLCSEAVAPGGLEIVATLNRNLKSFLFAIIGAEYVLRWLPRGTHDWRKFVTPTELNVLLRRSDLEPLKSAGVSVNPLTRTYQVVEDLSVNYMIVAARHD